MPTPATYSQTSDTTSTLVHTDMKTKIFSSIVVALLISIQAWAQYPVEVHVQLPPPYPVRLSDFTSIESNILITVNNTGTDPLNISLLGTLDNEDNGATIASDPSRLRGVCTS